MPPSLPPPPLSPQGRGGPRTVTQEGSVGGRRCPDTKVCLAAGSWGSTRGAWGKGASHTVWSSLGATAPPWGVPKLQHLSAQGPRGAERALEGGPPAPVLLPCVQRPRGLGDGHARAPRWLQHTGHPGWGVRLLGPPWTPVFASGWRVLGWPRGPAVGLQSPSRPRRARGGGDGGGSGFVCDLYLYLELLGHTASPVFTPRSPNCQGDGIEAGPAGGAVQVAGRLTPGTGRATRGPREGTARRPPPGASLLARGSGASGLQDGGASRSQGPHPTSRARRGQILCSI